MFVCHPLSTTEKWSKLYLDSNFIFSFIIPFAPVGGVYSLPLTLSPLNFVCSIIWPTSNSRLLSTVIYLLELFHPETAPFTTVPELSTIWISSPILKSVGCNFTSNCGKYFSGTKVAFDFTALNIPGNSIFFSKNSPIL